MITGVLCCHKYIVRGRTGYQLIHQVIHALVHQNTNMTGALATNFTEHETGWLAYISQSTRRNIMGGLSQSKSMTDCFSVLPITPVCVTLPVPDSRRYDGLMASGFITVTTAKRHIRPKQVMCEKGMTLAVQSVHASLSSNPPLCAQSWLISHVYCLL